MNKKDIASFFDFKAKTWDDELIINDDVVEAILQNGGVGEGTDILDIACGTGVLFPYYYEKGVASVTGIDISTEMVKIAKEKFPGATVIKGDAEGFPFEKEFDVIMIYNAFPHFMNPDALFENLDKYLKNGGRISVAHGMSKEEIDECHKGAAHKVSNKLPKAEELSLIMGEYFKIDTIISDSQMYQVSGIKNR